MFGTHRRYIHGMSFHPKSLEESRAKFKPMSRGKPMGHSRKEMKRTKMVVRSGKPLRSNLDPKLAAWSREVRKRDENQCQWPLSTCLNRGTLHAHHKATRGRRPDLVYNVDNGTTLCFVHHQWVHDHPIEATEIGLLNDETYEAAQKLERMKK